MMRFFLDCLRTSRGRARDDQGDAGVVETDERVLAKTAEIRELENAVAVENLELQEQQSDIKELEETLVKLDQHKERLQQQIKTTRQLCVEESQRILSLQAEESKKEGQVEEYERELARARWRLKKLREEVKNAKRRAEEAGERNMPLQDSIRQSYEEILQVLLKEEEEQTLCSLSGGAVTPESHLDESTSPADTTEEDPLPMRPWGRSQSLPAYADFVMRTSSSSFNNNLTETREEVADISVDTPKKEEAEVEDSQREIQEETVKDEEEALTTNPDPVNQLDFYKPDPFVHCQSEHDLFNEDIFPKTDSSDVFASDPFKGTDPFAADILFPEVGLDGEERATVVADEADTSLSCVENKASTGTQCFESEFPDEDSDIEISYSREDLDAIAADTVPTSEHQGFKPIQSSSEDLGIESCRGWRSQGQYSLESDPNGYELDLGAVSPPSDIEELSLGSLPGVKATENRADIHGLSSDLAQDSSELPDSGANFEAITAAANKQPLPCEVTSCQEAQCLGSEMDNNVEVEPQVEPVAPQNSEAPQNTPTQINSEVNTELSFEMSYQSNHSSFDPYGFKLSPEHSSHSLLDPDDELDFSPEPNDPDLAFDPEPPSSQLNFDPYGFDLTSSRIVSGDVFDPYGFKLSPEEENQEVLELGSEGNKEEAELCSYDNQEQVQPYIYSNQEVVEPCTHDNQEVPEPCNQSNQEMLDICSNGNQEILEPSKSDNKGVLGLFEIEIQELVDLCSPINQEVLEPFSDGNRELLGSQNHDNHELLAPYNYDNQEVRETSINNNQELLDSSCHGNQEVLKFCSDDNQELIQFSRNQEMLDLCSHDNQEVLDIQDFPETHNNHHCVPESKMDLNPKSDTSDISYTTNPENNSSSLLASEVSNNQATMDLQGLELSNITMCITDNTSLAVDQEKTINMSVINANQDLATFNVATSHNLLEGDLGSVFSAGGYVGCPDVADDLEPLERRQGNPIAEPVQSVQPVRPVRPPRPSLRAKEKAQSQSQGIDLK